MNKTLNAITFVAMGIVAWIGVEIYSYDLAHQEQIPREIGPAESATTFFIAYMPIIWTIIVHLRNKINLGQSAKSTLGE